MAIDFGAGTTEAPNLPTAQSPTKPVESEPVFLKGLSNVFEQAGDILEAGRAKRNDQLVSDFTKQQLLVAEGVDQRQYSSAFARTLMRRNLIKAIESSPGISKELVAAQSSILGIAGGAKVVDEGTEEEQRIEKRFSQLVSQGFLAPDASDAEFSRADGYARNLDNAQRTYEQTIREIDGELKSINLSSARRTELEEQREDATWKAVSEGAPAHFQATKTRMEAIINGPGTEAEKEQAINEFYSQMDSELVGVFGDLTDSRSSALRAPLEMLKETSLRRARGEITDEENARLIQRAVTSQQRIIASDPDLARVAAAQKMFPAYLQNLTAANNRSFKAATRYLAGNSPTQPGTESPFTTDVDDKDGLRAYTDQVIDSVQSPDPEIVQEGRGHLNKLLESIEDYSGVLRRNPETGIQLANFLASPGFFKAVSEGTISQEAMDSASDIIQRHYADEVWGLVRSKFREAEVVQPGAVTGTTFGMMGGVTETRGADEVTPVPQGVIAQPVANGVKFMAADPSDQRFVNEAIRLNRELSPIINNTVKAMAHLEGRNDYRAMWEEVSADILGQGLEPTQAEPAGRDEGDDLQIDDFDEDVAVPDQPRPLQVGAQNIVTNDSLQPIFGMDGASRLTTTAAPANMEAVLNGPFATLQKSFGGTLLINDAIAKAGTSREVKTENSQHFHGNALDISVAGMSDEDRLRLVREARAAGFKGFGFGRNILHIDVGRRRGWAYGNTTFGGRSVSDLIGSVSR